MARVKYQKAAKDYPASGIKKGDMYYYVRIKTGPRSSRQMRQLTPFKPSQLTTSDYLSQAYALQERFNDLTDLTTLEEDLNGLAEEARDLGQEQQDKYDNMPEGLQQGGTGELLEQRAQAMESWADSLEQAASSANEKLPEYEDNQKAWAEYKEAAERENDEDGEDGVVAEPDDPELDLDELVEEIKSEVEEPDLS